jgi:hypothetical protein
MKTTLRTALIMMVAFALMAGTGWAKKEMRKSGFLSDYSKLKEGKKGQAEFVYIKEGANWKSYDKIMIDHLVFFMSEDAQYKGIQPDELKEIADTWHRAFIQAVQGDYEITHEPGPGVLRFRAAITDVSPTKRALNMITTVVPVGLAFSVIKKGVTGAGTGVGKVTSEAEILDSSTNEVLAAAIDFKAGQKYRVDKALSKWGHIRLAIESWAKSLRDRLGELSGRK